MKTHRAFYQDAWPLLTFIIASIIVWLNFTAYVNYQGYVGHESGIPLLVGSVIFLSIFRILMLKLGIKRQWSEKYTQKRIIRFGIAVVVVVGGLWALNEFLRSIAIDFSNYQF